MKYTNNRDDTIVDFDRHYQSFLLDIENDIDKTLGLYKLILSKNPDYCLKENIEYFILILRSIDYLISATNLVRQRAVTEAGCIIRLSLETSAVAIHIHGAGTAEFQNYKQNKYKSTTKAISYANLHIKGFGELWGALSTVMVHPNTFHGIYSKLKDNLIEENGLINIGFKPQNENQDKKMLLLLKISANIIFRCLEIIVTKKASYKGLNILRLEKCDMFMLGTNTEILVNELIDRFKNEQS